MNAMQAAVFLGVSRTKFWKLLSEGRVPEPLRFMPRSPRWRRADLQKFINEMATEQHGPPRKSRTAT